MTERPILFSAPMVRALLEGRKTQTRRSSPIWGTVNVGDLLWVRETIKQRPMVSLFGEPMPNHIVAAYAADDEDVVEDAGFNLAPWWKGKGSLSAIHMPRWASRITLLVKEVRVQRLHDISEEDAKAEGIRPLPLQSADDPSAWWQSGPGENHSRSAIGSFRSLWESINGAGSWDANPWVYAVTFAVEQAKAEAVAA